MANWKAIEPVNRENFLVMMQNDVRRLYDAKIITKKEFVTLTKKLRKEYGKL